MAEEFDERGEPVAVAQEMPPEMPQEAQPAPPMMPPPRSAQPAQAPQVPYWMQPQFQAQQANESRQRAISGYMQQMAQAGRLDRAQKDVEQAMRFLGMRGVEKDVQGGVPYAQALAKHLPYLSWGSPQHAAAYSKVIQQSAPPTPLSMANVGGVNVLRTPRGDRIVPRSALPQEPLTAAKTIPLTGPGGEEIPNYIAVPSATGRGFTLHPRKPTEPSLSPAQERMLIKDQIKTKQDEIDSAKTAKFQIPEKDKPALAAHADRVKQLNSELSDLRKRQLDFGASKTKTEGAKDHPKVGQVIGGYEFLGGDPAKKESWRKTKT